MRAQSLRACFKPDGCCLQRVRAFIPAARAGRCRCARPERARCRSRLGWRSPPSPCADCLRA
eukprot:6199773-Pleurochrysis_carterae.AAC.2